MIIFLLMSALAVYGLILTTVRLCGWAARWRASGTILIRPLTATAASTPIDREAEELMASIVADSDGIADRPRRERPAGNATSGLVDGSSFRIVGEGRHRTILVEGSVVACDDSFATINLGSADGVWENALIELEPLVDWRRSKGKTVRPIAVLAISRVEEHVAHGRCFGGPIERHQKVCLRIGIE